MNKPANLCPITPQASKGTYMLQYSTPEYQAKVIEAKNKTEVIKAMFGFISRSGANAGAEKDYWDKLKKMGVIE